MSRGSREEEDEEEVYDSEEEEEEEGEVEERGGKRSRGGGGGGKWSGVESFIDDAASEDEDEEEEEDDDEDYVGGGGGRARKRKRASILIDDMAQVDDEEEEEEDGEFEDGFIDDTRADDPDQDVGRSSRRHPSSMLDEEEDVDALVKLIHDRYIIPSSHFVDDDDGVTEVEQQALLPSVKDPKLWMVKCAIGHERETAICLMQKSIDTPDLQIKSVLALDHLKNYIYVEAYKEAHVKEACKGVRNIFASRKVTLVPIREVADVLSVQSKSTDISINTWVRMKLGAYKGDLAKVVDVDDVHQKVTVKLIPRIDLQALANKFDGLKVVKEKKSFVPPPKLFSANEARRNRDSGEYYEMVDGLKFKDGFLHKTFSIKSISAHNIQPSFDELEKFREPDNDINEDAASLSTLFTNRKKGHFMKGDSVIVIKGDLKNLEGYVEKAEDATVHIRSKLPGLLNTLVFNEGDLCKCFNPGDHVKVVSGVQEGATGLVVKVEGHVLIILSDTTKEHIRVFADHVVESSEVTTGLTRIGDYELHDLVLLGESKGLWNIYTEEYFLFMIVTTLNIQALSVQAHNHASLLGDQLGMGTVDPRFGAFRSSARILQSPGRLPPKAPHTNYGRRFGGRDHGGKGHDTLVNRCIKIKSGPYKGYRGRVKEMTGALVRVELDSLMKVVAVKREDIADTATVATPFGESHNSWGNETPVHPSRTPLRPFQTPLRDPGATPVPNGMRTPMPSRAWAPMSPPRNGWEDAVTWESSPTYQPGTPVPQPHEAPTPGSGWAVTPGVSFGDASGKNPSSYATPTPSGQPMTPNPASYLPSTPGGQPMTLGYIEMDIMSPAIGEEGGRNWLLPDVLVNVLREGYDTTCGVVKEVLPDGSCRVALGSSGSGDEITAFPNEFEVVKPKKNDKLKIMSGSWRGLTGKLLGVDGSDGIVKVDGLETTDQTKILDTAILGKLAA
ncbi:Os02g0772000 [Oryza sativa Japonica Group]|uniref:Os02g0772000 protein n=2 Tax=Oryza sativa subsp. japonica TaxID=39947 RepID=C7IY85_ORYSJ|nr:Os02g0772000 [Oryza sativa Japonica Group]|eukprot:NP_001173159.1 Os02g0772000 [Oryza sativa Japonica Group]